MNYKVCIMAAGKGTRLSYAKDFNKALLPVGDKSALSHIIDKFPKNIEVVIAIGYNANLVKDFVKMAYPDRKITLVEVDKYEGKGSGPGHSLYYCRQHLQCPFIFTSADTIVLETVPEPNRNWLGVAKTDDPQNYCIAGVYNGLVKAFYIKMSMTELLKRYDDPKNILNNAFIGMAGVCDYKSFWLGFAKKHARVEGEVQVMDGLEELINKPLHTQFFTWFDTGSDANYYKTNQHFNKSNFLVKPGEFLYFENDYVIKYFADIEIVKNRVYRSDLLKGIVPELVHYTNHFYSYKYIRALTLNKIEENSVFEKFLQFCQTKLWQEIKLSAAKKNRFDDAVRKFYLNKTKHRLEKFYRETDIKDKEEMINGVKVPSLSFMLNQIEWDKLLSGVPVIFHGDLQPENILVHDNKFVLIDWRHDFGGLLDYGDVYYDFAKLYHALLISNEVIRKEGFTIRQENGDIYYNYLLKNNLLEFKNIFEKFLINNAYDLKKVKILASLVLLNIAPLNYYPYNIFLYYFGKDMLYRYINNIKDI